MHKIKLILDNRQSIILVIFLLVLLFILSILIPFLIINYLALSGIGTFFNDNIIFNIQNTILFIFFKNYCDKMKLKWKKKENGCFSLYSKSYVEVITYLTGAKKKFVNIDCLSASTLFIKGLFNGIFSCNATFEKNYIIF